MKTIASHLSSIIRRLFRRQTWTATRNEEPGLETEQVSDSGHYRHRHLDEIPSGFPPHLWPFWNDGPLPVVAAVLVCCASAQAQVNEDYQPQEWLRSEDGTQGVLLQRFPLGEDKPSIIGFYLSDLSCAVQNAPQDVPTDNACNAQTNAAPPIQGVTASVQSDAITLLRQAATSIEWFVSNEPQPQELSPPPPAKKANRQAALTRSKRILADIQSYLGGRIN